MVTLVPKFNYNIGFFGLESFNTISNNHLTKKLKQLEYQKEKKKKKR